MDDDPFGADVWGTSSNSPGLPPPPKSSFTIPPPTPSSSQSATFDDFDDFEEPATAAVSTDAADDDFGDFGDFDDADGIAGPTTFEEQSGFIETPASVTRPPDDWEALRLTSTTSRADLRAQLDQLLNPLWADEDLDAVMSSDDIRQVEGRNQILITPESRALWDLLFKQPPPAPQPNWTRSRTRREHLIALGIPINLDEVLPQAGGKPLPALHITTRPMSAPPAPRPGPSNGAHGTSQSRGGSRVATPRSGTPQPRNGGDVAVRLGLGPKPVMDDAKITELLDMNPESLTLVPITKLQAHLAEIQKQTANTSALLAYLLQTRDALQQDSDTYNKLIGELIGEAQKAKVSGKGRAPSRAGSLKK